MVPVVIGAATVVVAEAEILAVEAEAGAVRVADATIVKVQGER